MQDQIITKQSACLLESSVLRVCHVSLVGVLMSPYEIRADLSFSLSGSLSNWNGFILCLVKERERESVGQLSTAYTAFLLINTLPVPPPKIFTYPCTQPPTPCTPLGELLGVCMCMRDDFSSRSLGCVFFFFLWRSRIDNKNRPAHKKSLREKHVLLPPPPPAHTLHPPIIIPAGGRRLQFLSIQTGNASK